MAAWCGLYLAYSPFGSHTDLYLNGELVTNLVIPDGTKRIFSGTFQGFQSLTDVTIPESVTEIDSSAFSGCSSLTNVTIPESVTVIGSSAFSGCSSLTNVTIPESVTKIGSFAFSGCSSLTSVIVPESVTRIEYCAFSDCPSLTIYCEATKKPSNWDRDWNRSSYVMWGYAGEHGVTDDGFRWGSTTSGIVITGYHGTAVDVVIPDAISGNPVVSIQNTFQRNTTITGVTIPESVTEIVSSAFSGCSSLTSITIPDSVKSIGESAFSGCTSLTSAVFADPNGWHRSLYEGSSDSYYISSVYLSKSSDAAKYLTSTYNTYYWFKE